MGSPLDSVGPPRPRDGETHTEVSPSSSPPETSAAGFPDKTGLCGDSQPDQHLGS